MSRPTFALGLASILALSLAACGGRSGDAAQAGAGQQGGASQDEWITIEGVDFPPRLAKAPPDVREAYVFAAKHPEVLHYIPCYCGCEQSQPPHRSNYDCFVDQIDRGGERPRVRIDAMGFG